MRLTHVIESQQFEINWLIEELFPLADKMEKVVKKKHGWYWFKYFFDRRALAGKEMISLYYEPSTRTRVSHEIAMVKQGGNIASATEHAKIFSSIAKGESIEDSVRVFNGYYPDVIVIRTDEEGMAKRAAAVSAVPIINAGDGVGQHPTQALLDLYTIYKEFGRVTGISIAMCGDLNRGRTVRSLSYLLGKFPDVKIYFVSPEVARMRDDIKNYLKRHNIWFTEERDLRTIASKVDVIYQTRTQKEREERGELLTEHEKNLGFYIVNQEILDRMKKDAIIMHPLPRNEEIAPEVDSDHRAAYFRQAENGLYIRMALLRLILKPKRN